MKKLEKRYCVAQSNGNETSNAWCLCLIFSLVVFSLYRHTCAWKLFILFSMNVLKIGSSYLHIKHQRLGAIIQ